MTLLAGYMLFNTRLLGSVKLTLYSLPMPLFLHIDVSH